MSEGKILAVFCYDISQNKARQRAIKLLEEHSVRVQESVFEGWMTRRIATALAERISLFIDETDCLRVYFLGTREASRTLVYGATPPVELDEFFLL